MCGVLFFALTPENLFDKKLFENSYIFKHIIAFFVLSVFLFKGFDYSKPIKIIILVILAFMIEFLQFFVGRQASFEDFVLSVSGIFLFLLLSRLFKNF